MIYRKRPFPAECVGTFDINRLYQALRLGRTAEFGGLSHTVVHYGRRYLVAQTVNIRALIVRGFRKSN
jgi:hypothetical protein